MKLNSANQEEVEKVNHGAVAAETARCDEDAGHRSVEQRRGAIQLRDMKQVLWVSSFCSEQSCQHRDKLDRSVHFQIFQHRATNDIPRFFFVVLKLRHCPTSCRRRRHACVLNMMMLVIVIVMVMMDDGG